MFTQTSFREPALSSASQAGLVNNLNDGLAWGLFPILFAGAGLSVARIESSPPLYPAVWGVGQLVTGALSDRWGCKWLIAAGMWLQAVALALTALADAFAPGRGRRPARRRHRDGLPDLLASIGDVAHPAWRARSVDLPTSGATAASPSAPCSPASSPTRSASALPWTVAGLTAVSGLVVAVRMYEIPPPPGHGCAEQGRGGGPHG